MRRITFIVGCLIMLKAAAQTKGIDRSAFFKDTKIIAMTLSTDLKGLLAAKKVNDFQPAEVTMRFPDSTTITAPLTLSARGQFRRTNCYVPTMKLDFGKKTNSKLANLHKLKLVCGCGVNASDEKLLVKEFLTYKIYNLLTEMSFRVRMMRIDYVDTRGKIKPYTQYGFLIEDEDDMAKRNKCKKIEKTSFNTEGTDRDQMTLVAVFQYMIGNTDWAVPNYHNIKLLQPANDSLAVPFVIPYDFDYSGLVDAEYAIPPEELGISKVTERVYRGFSRTMPELNKVMDLFKKKRDAIKELIMTYEPLAMKSRKEMVDYIDEFYDDVSSANAIKNRFIDGARKE